MVNNAVIVMSDSQQLAIRDFVNKRWKLLYGNAFLQIKNLWVHKVCFCESQICEHKEIWECSNMEGLNLEIMGLKCWDIFNTLINVCFNEFFHDTQKGGKEMIVLQQISSLTMHKWYSLN